MEDPGLCNPADKTRYERAKRKFLNKQIELVLVKKQIKERDGRILEEPKLVYADTGTINRGKQFELVEIKIPEDYREFEKNLHEYVDSSTFIETEKSLVLDLPGQLKSVLEFGYKFLVDNSPKKIVGTIRQVPNPKSWYYNAQLRVENCSDTLRIYYLLDPIYHRFWKNAN